MARLERPAQNTVRVPGIGDDPSPVHPLLRAVVALALGVGLGALAALFTPRRRSR